MAERDDDDLIGTWLGEFYVRKRLDEGGFGRVYLCEQPTLERLAVIKVLHPQRRNDGDAARHFLREATLASRLDHPYAAHVYAFDVKPGSAPGVPSTMWIAMEHVAGMTLTRWRRERGGRLPLELFAPFFACVAEVVQAVHDLGIVHRDLKPLNIMVTHYSGKPLPKLLDLGIAKDLDSNRDSASVAYVGDDAPPPELAMADEPLDERSGELSIEAVEAAVAMASGVDTARIGGRLRPVATAAGLGSPPYMAPECWSTSVDVGTAADRYALGVILYEAITGRRPWAASSVEAWSDAHCREPVPPVGEDLPPELDAFFAKALAKRPGDRFATALEMADAINSIVAAQPAARVRAAAAQWRRGKRAAELLWRGDSLAELERWLIGAELSLDRTGLAFVEACRADARSVAEARQRAEAAAAEAERRAQLAAIEARQREERAAAEARARETRRRSRLRRWLAAGAAAAGLAAIQYRGYVKGAAANELAEQSVTVAEREQGRQALLHNEHAEARQHLGAAYQRGDRSPETEFMLARALQSQLAEVARFPAVSGRMWSSRFSPGGTRIVTTDDKAAQVWDATTHKLLFTLQHGAAVYDALYSADGARLVTVTDRAVRVWDAATGAPIRELVQPRLDGAAPDYYKIALSPDPRIVAALDSRGSELHTWTIDGAALTRSRLAGAAFPRLAFSADGRWLAATGGGDEVLVHETATWRSLVIPTPRARAITFDPTGPRVLVGTSAGDVSIWDVPSATRVRHLREIGEPIDVAAYSPDGQLLVTGARDGAEQIWDAKGQLKHQTNELHGQIQAIEFDPTSRFIASTGSTGSIVVIDAVRAAPAVAVLEAPGVLRAVHFDRAARHVVAASSDGTARVWSASPLYQRWTSPEISENCGFVTSSAPDGRFVAIGCGQRTIVWDTAHDSLLAEIPGDATAGNDVAPAWPVVSSSGDRAAIARGRQVEIYQLPGGKLVRTVPHGAAVTALAFATDGRDLVSGDADGGVMLTRGDLDSIALPAARAGIDAVAFAPDAIVVADAAKRLRFLGRDGSAAGEVPVAARAMTLRISPDGTRLVVGAAYVEPTPPSLWDLASRQLVAELAGRGPVFAIRFMSDRVITSGSDGAARLWDARSGELIQTYQTGARFVADATVDPSGALFITGDADGLVRFWDLAKGRALWTLRAHRSAVVGLHFNGVDLITRGIGGDVARWTFPASRSVITACNTTACGNVVP